MQITLSNVKNCLEQYVCHSHLANREYLPHNLTRAGGGGQAQHTVYADLWEEGVRQDSMSLDLTSRPI